MHLPSFFMSIIVGASMPAVSGQTDTEGNGEINQGTIIINRLPESDLQERLATLKALMANGRLDSLAIRSLDKLRAKAEQIATINQECNSTSINAIPNSQCKNFYLKELPEFEKEYSLVTGNIYMNRLTLAKAMKDRRNQINECIQGMEAFLNPDFSPQKFASLKVKNLVIDPVDDKTIDVHWTVSQIMDIKRKELLEKRISSWDSACIDIVKNSEGQWNPYFLSQAKQHFEPSNFIVGAGYIEYREGWIHRAFLNGKELISFENPANEDLHFYLNTDPSISWNWDEEKSGTLRLPEDSLKAITTNEKIFSPHFGSITDSRDGKIYKTVNVGDQNWMAENLNYAGHGNDLGTCYANDSTNCEKYGRLYSWDEISKNPEGVCPNGWHIPNDSEETSMIKAQEKSLMKRALNILPAGSGRSNNGKFRGIGKAAHLWFFPESGASFECSNQWCNIFDISGNAYTNFALFSLRCIQKKEE